MVDAFPGNIGNVQQAVDASFQFNKGTIIGDIFHHAFEHLTFAQVGDQLGAFFCAGFFQHGAAGNDYITAVAVHLKYLERLRVAHQRINITDWPDIDLTSGQEGDCAREIDGKATFDAAKNNAIDPFFGFKSFFQYGPGFFAARFVTAQYYCAVTALITFDKNVNFIAGANIYLAAGFDKFFD